MKKLLLVFSFIFILTACSANTIEGNNPGNSISSTQGITSADMSIAVDGTISADLINKDIVPITQKSYASYKQPDPDMQSIYIRNEVKNVVFGTVEKVQFTDDNAQAHTVYSFAIEKVIKGELKTGDIISVAESGGFVRMSKYIEVYGDAHFPDMPEEQRQNGIMHQSYSGAPLTEVGQKFLLFLGDPLAETEREAGAYYTIGGFTGKYIMQSDGLLARYEPEENFYSLIDPGNAERPMTLAQANQLLGSL